VRTGKFCGPVLTDLYPAGVWRGQPAGRGNRRRYEIALTEAASYRVQLSMACTRDLLLPETFAPFNLSINILRFGADGTPVLTHNDLQQALLPPTRNFRCVAAASRVGFDQTVVFDAPATPGQKDRVVAMVFGGNGATALDTSARGTDGLSDRGSMNGFVQVDKVGSWGSWAGTPDRLLDAGTWRSVKIPPLRPAGFSVSRCWSKRLTVTGYVNLHPKREGASNMKITTVGIDLAKNVFQVHGIDQQGKVVFRKQT
jgi:hypothetical protein